MTDRELMQMALGALEDACANRCNAENNPCWQREVAEALRARLAQPEQEPVAWMHDSHVGFNVPLYTAPPQREWQGLTDEEMQEAMEYWSDPSRSAYGGAWRANGEYVDMVDAWRYIEAKLKEKNA